MSELKIIHIFNIIKIILNYKIFFIKIDLNIILFKLNYFLHITNETVNIK